LMLGCGHAKERRTVAPIGKPKRRIHIEPKREAEPVRRDDPAPLPKREAPTPRRREKVPA
jgi:hypothetical protein